MRYELLMQIIVNKLFFDLFLTEVIYFISWFIFFKLGFRIACIAEQKGLILGALTVSLSNLFIKPFLPMPIAVLLPVVTVVIFLKIYGKVSFLKSTWASFLLHSSIILGVILIAGPLCLNKNISYFLLKTVYGNLVGAVIEALFPTIALVLLSKNPNISLIPPLIEKKVDIVAVITLGSTFYFVYSTSIKLLTSLKDNSSESFMHLAYDWMAMISSVAGYYIILTRFKRKYTRLEYENEKLTELQAVITEKNQQLMEKDQQIMELFEAFRNIVKDQGSRDAIPDEADKLGQNITEREIKFIKYLEKGLSYKEIGTIEKLSPSRVGDIIATIKKKLNATSQAQIPIIAMKNKII